MGQEQSSVDKKASTDMSQGDIDVISAIYEEEKQKSTAKHRMIQALRMSEKQYSHNQSEVEKMQEIQERNEESFLQFQGATKDQPEMLILQPAHLSKKIQKVYLKKGVLEKESPSVFGSDSQRFCTLTENRFVYHNDKSEISEKAGILDFNLLSCHVTWEDHTFRIKIDGCDKKFIFRSPKSDQQTKNWFEQIKMITGKSIGVKLGLQYLSKYHRFWRKDYLSEKDFRDRAETGDIILMRGRKNMAALQRAITQEEYDHIAIVLKNSRDQILLFQANGGVGVGIMPWHRFVNKKYYKKQELVVYRKLQMERSEAFMDLISEFVQRNMGRKYKFSIKKYLMGQGEVESHEDIKTYFCSSLVAKLYKNLQILDPKKSATKYMPASFSEKQKLGLRQNGKFGASKLEHQKIIVFEEHFFEQES